MTFSDNGGKEGGREGGRLMHTVGKLANLYLLMIHGYLLLAVQAECWGAVVWSGFGCVGGVGRIRLHFCGFLNRVNGSC